MSVSSFREGDTRCYGRETELSALLGRIETHVRSATLVYGDSGIGKSILLQELCRRLDGTGSLTGFHECARGESADPLLRCLESLVERHLRSFENWQGQLQTAFQRTWRNLQKPERLRAFFLGLTRAAAELPILKEFGKAGSEAIAAVTQVTGLAEGLSAELVPRLSPDVFRDVIAILLDAFPDKKFVFIIDNLSADAESLSHAPGTIMTTDAFLSFLATAFQALSRLHFVLSWKESAETQETFDRLTRQFTEYGGDATPLGPLSAESMSVLLGDRFAWFRETSGENQARVIGLSKGLPIVVDWWGDSKVDSLDFDRLWNLAGDAISRKYQSLARDIQKSPDVEFLYQLVLLPVIPSARRLAEMTGRTGQDVRPILERWCEKRLLRRAGASYQFDHETKQIVARSILLNALDQDTRFDLARGLCHFYLRNAGFPDDQHPNAPDYVFQAFNVAREIWLPKPELTALFWAVVCLQLPEEQHGWPPVPDWEQFFRLPWNTRFMLFHAAAMRLPETSEFLDHVFPNVIEDSRRANSSTENIAKGLVNVHNKYAKTGRQLESERLLRELRELQGANPASSALAKCFAEGLYDALTIHGKAARVEKVRELLEELRELQRRRPTEPELAHILAEALFNALTAYGKAGSLPETDRIVQQLRELQHTRVGSAQIALELAKGLVNAIQFHAAASHVEEADRLLQELRAVERAQPQHSGFTELLTRGIVGAIKARRQAKRHHDVGPLIDELRDACRRHSEEALSQVLSVGLAEGLETYLDANDFERLLPLLDDLRRLHARDPAASLPMEALAIALYKVMKAFLSADRSEEGLRLLTELQTVQRQHRDERAIGLTLAQALVDALNELDEGSVATAVVELRRLRDEFPGDTQMAYQLPCGLSNALLVYSRTGNLQASEPLIRELRQLQVDDPSLPRVVFAIGLMHALGVYKNSHDASQVESVLDDLRQLRRKDPTPYMTSLLGNGLVNAIGASEDANRVDDVDRHLEELLALLGDEHDAPEVTMAVAAGLAQAVPAYRDPPHMERIESFLERLRGLRRRNAEDPGLAEVLAAALFNAVPAYRRAGAVDKLASADEELVSLAALFPTSSAITRIQEILARPKSGI